MSDATPRYRMETLFEGAKNSREFVTGAVGRMVELLEALDAEKIAELIRIIEGAVARNSAIFMIGNGGSAAVASHIVNDLCANSHVAGAPQIRVYSLTDNVASVTALANDIGYEHIFSRQLEQLLRPNDVVVAFSVSGNSKNIVKAIEYANAHDAATVGVCGFDGGWLGEHAHLTIHVPSTADEFGPVEDVFACVGHVVSAHITLDRGRRLSH